VRETPGRGIAGRVSRRLVRVGSLRFAEENGAVVPDELRAAARGFAERGLAPVVVAVDARVEAVLGIGDPVRADASATVAQLQSRGWRVLLASGDDPLVAQSVARTVGIGVRDAFGGLSPEEKLALVQRADLARPVVMVGDGINDLAALAAADVGVSVRSGAQASHLVADACLAGHGLRPLARFLEGARTTMSAIRINLAISIAYNALGGALAFAGLVNPLVAAVLMPVSGLTVLVLALRIPRFECDTGREVL
jgi:Cu2+-exporting ATPase